MENLMRHILLFILIGFSVSGCKKYDLDVKGHAAPYHNVNERFADSQFWNDNHARRVLTVNSDDYFFFVAGDSHIGETDNLETMYQAAEVNAARAVFLAGDVTTGKTEDYETAYQFLIQHDSIPTFTIVGNHDLFFNGWNTWLPTFGSSSYDLEVKTPASQDLFLILDTGSGTIGEDQKQWLEHILETRRKENRHCFVITHQNFFRTRFTTSTNPNVEEILYLLELFLSHDVNLVITGHEHTRSVDQFGFTNYVTLDAIQDINNNASYLWVDAKMSGVSWRFKNLN